MTETNEKLGCPRCKSLIFKAGVAIKCKNQGPLLEGIKKEQNIQPEEYWKVDNMMKFENIGFTNTVNNRKYLICADCEIGPLGFQNLDEPNKLFLAVQRIKHDQS